MLTDYQVVDITTRKTRQGVEFIEIRKCDYGMFRVYLERDFYPDQCEAMVSKWSDDKGWVFFHGLDARKQAFMAIPVSAPEVDTTKFHETASILWDTVDRFFS